MISRGLFCLCLLLTSVCPPGIAGQEGQATVVDRFADLLTGAFSNEDQARKDTSYPHVWIHIVPLWETEGSGRWLYVEEAVAERLFHPYRQRVYQILDRSDTTVELVVYAIGGAQRFVGAWKQPGLLKTLDRDSLFLRNGCSMVFHPRESMTFVGRTMGKGCSSSLQGASYVTSELVLAQDSMVLWNRGYTAAGEQAWGSRKGGFVFRKTGAAGK
jgi:hypothetical protein